MPPSDCSGPGSGDRAARRGADTGGALRASADVRPGGRQGAPDRGGGGPGACQVRTQGGRAGGACRACSETAGLPATVTLLMVDGCGSLGVEHFSHRSTWCGGARGTGRAAAGHRAAAGEVAYGRRVSGSQPKYPAVTRRVRPQPAMDRGRPAHPKAVRALARPTLPNDPGDDGATARPALTTPSPASPAAAA